MSTVLVFTLCISLILVNQCFANGVLRDSMGPVAAGRGGTNIASTDNGVLIHDNPAALTEMNGQMLEVDLDFLSLAPTYSDPQNSGEDSDDSFVFIPSISYAKELEPGRLGVGFGVYSPAGFFTDYDLVHPVWGTQEYSSEAALTKILLAVGWKYKDEVSVGLAAGPAFSKIGFEQPWHFQTLPAAHPLYAAPVLMDLEGDAWAFAWNIGAQWRMSPDTTLGLAYHAPNKFDMEGDVDVDASALVGVPFTSNYDVEFDFTWPQSVEVGMTHRLKDGHRVSADVAWIDWSSAFDDVKFKFSDSSNAGFDAALGTPTPQDTLRLDWKDSYAVRLGYEHLLTEVDTFRCGYVYNKNPIPESTLIPTIPGILEHVVSVGYGRNWENWTFDFAYAYSWASDQSVDNDTEIIGGDYNNSELEMDAMLVRLGIRYNF
jgi:long-chain fatty acid transport protein